MLTLVREPVLAADLHLSTKTDGHIYDMKILDKPVTLALNWQGQKMEIPLFEMAQDLFSGGNGIGETLMMRINQKALDMGLEKPFSYQEGLNEKEIIGFMKASGGKLLSDILVAGKADSRYEIAQQIAAFEGQMLALIIEHIYNGDIRKWNPSADWSQEDRDFVKGTKNFILGGSVTKGSFGTIVEKTAREELAAKGLVDVQLILPKMDTAKAGVLGAAGFVNDVAKMKTTDSDSAMVAAQGVLVNGVVVDKNLALEAINLLEKPVKERFIYKIPTAIFRRYPYLAPVLDLTLPAKETESKKRETARLFIEKFIRAKHPNSVKSVSTETESLALQMERVSPTDFGLRFSFDPFGLRVKRLAKELAAFLKEEKARIEKIMLPNIYQVPSAQATRAIDMDLRRIKSELIEQTPEEFESDLAALKNQTLSYEQRNTKMYPLILKSKGERLNRVKSTLLEIFRTEAGIMRERAWNGLRFMGIPGEEIQETPATSVTTDKAMISITAGLIGFGVIATYIGIRKFFRYHTINGAMSMLENPLSERSLEKANHFLRNQQDWPGTPDTKERLFNGYMNVLKNSMHIGSMIEAIEQLANLGIRQTEAIDTIADYLGGLRKRDAQFLASLKKKYPPQNDFRDYLADWMYKLDFKFYFSIGANTRFAARAALVKLKAPEEKYVPGYFAAVKADIKENMLNGKKHIAENAMAELRELNSDKAKKLRYDGYLEILKTPEMADYVLQEALEQLEVLGHPQAKTFKKFYEKLGARTFGQIFVTGTIYEKRFQEAWEIQNSGYEFEIIYNEEKSHLKQYTVDPGDGGGLLLRERKIIDVPAHPIEIVKTEKLPDALPSTDKAMLVRWTTDWYIEKGLNINIVSKENTKIHIKTIKILTHRYLKSPKNREIIKQALFNMLTDFSKEAREATRAALAKLNISKVEIIAANMHVLKTVWFDPAIPEAIEQLKQLESDDTREPLINGYLEVLKTTSSTELAIQGTVERLRHLRSEDTKERIINGYLEVLKTPGNGSAIEETIKELGDLKDPRAIPLILKYFSIYPTIATIALTKLHVPPKTLITKNMNVLKTPLESYILQQAIEQLRQLKSDDTRELFITGYLDVMKTSDWSASIKEAIQQLAALGHPQVKIFQEVSNRISSSPIPGETFGLFFRQALDIRLSGCDFKIPEYSNPWIYYRRNDLDNPVIVSIGAVDNALVTKKNVGGIDMNNINLKGDGKGTFTAFTFQFDLKVMEQFKDVPVDNLSPVIINIVPIPSILPLLGLKEDTTEKLAKAEN
ncbi:MAG: hypothetical protein HQL24_04610 [Candidatus Omnitrophica bacterium]|nr:hypothetical protein [Candidatus Omnitrophota bacterium]